MDELLLTYESQDKEKKVGRSKNAGTLCHSVDSYILGRRNGMNVDRNILADQNTLWSTHVDLEVRDYSAGEECAAEQWG